MYWHPTLSLHDALPIFWIYGPEPERPGGRSARPRGGCPYRRDADRRHRRRAARAALSAPRTAPPAAPARRTSRHREDRKSTRLNSSHLVISYALVFLIK